MDTEKEVKVKRRHKAYMKLNIMTLFFVGVSFISITLAWFAYSGLITARTEVNVKAWHIEFNKNGTPVSNELTIRLNDISPGMETMEEVIDIKNQGDTAAAVTYEITSARILETTLDGTEQEELKDKLSHDYPFHIDMSLSDNFIRAHDGTGSFKIAVSWPFESDNDEEDSKWGMDAYDFQLAESQKEEAERRYAIKLEISLKAVQYIDEVDAIDHDFRTGNIVLYDVKNNEKCNAISPTCLKTYVIDRDSRMSDTSVHLLPELQSTYVTGKADQYETKLQELTTNWTVKKEGLKAEDILPIISNDITSSILMRPKLSNEAIGYLNYGTRTTAQINKAISYGGSFRFINEEYPYFSSTKCYWLNTNYKDNKQFALKKIDETYSKVYGEDKTTECSIVPVIEVAKDKLR